VRLGTRKGRGERKRSAGSPVCEGGGAALSERSDRTGSPIAATGRWTDSVRSRQTQLYYALIELLLETGLRVAEATNLRIGDVDLHDRSGVVRVRESEGRKQRQVPLN